MFLSVRYKSIKVKFRSSWTNTGSVFSGASLISRGKGASLPLVGDPSSDGVAIKMSYVVDILHRPVSHCYLFLMGWLKLTLALLLDKIETGLGRWKLVVAVIGVDAYPFLAFSDLTCHLVGMGISVFWLHSAWY